ncbi:antitoxin Xre/MbcA/ParS toxin-binding domain-containing protein [Hydrogenophaga intermedia]|jgi:putative toxin-antitoxin system antitoxin component (TIGR02293 family)|uniref:antitoxin Xre/MbcA/ParS toxin-binding domain-containing protein n=1 Tax=Hydrogenophaga intermedia TaxID=65786 RepID=UPI002044C3F1|nr:antitoxin Xre/MbcA/ParS toxin-binding domain-containing protein [Hydrogenophaga intermedia]MCM3565390.1 DUF2384 domain-containing protein [Hydrogenophaga intermedia]
MEKVPLSASTHLARYLEEGELSQLELHQVVLAGIPTAEVAEFLSAFKSIPKRDLLAVLGLSEKTLLKRKASTMTPAVSGAALDMGGILRTAVNVLGSMEEAEHWLAQPAVAFRGQRPIELLATRQGTQLVRSQLVCMEHGVYI